MLNAINGIIVDTFQSLREENNVKNHIKKEICYMCSFSRSKFETNGIDFRYHITKEHNIIAYLHYIYKVKNMPKWDMNLHELEVFNKLNENRINFFPIRASASLRENYS